MGRSTMQNYRDMLTRCARLVSTEMIDDMERLIRMLEDDAYTREECTEEARKIMETWEED